MAADQADWNLSAEAEMSAKRQVKKESDARQKHVEDDDDDDELSRASKRTFNDEVSKSSSHPTSATVALHAGKENQNENQINQLKRHVNKDDKEYDEINQMMGHEEEQQCHECNKSLSRSKHLVSISGQTNQWHPECFKCNVCLRLLDRDTSCHLYRDKIICREDYLKLRRDLTTKCSRCHWPIGASDWVRRASQYVYHLACFSCDICMRQLSTGEQFTVRVQKKNVVQLLCRLHFAIDTNKNPSLKARRNGGGGGDGVGRDEDYSADDDRYATQQRRDMKSELANVTTATTFELQANDAANRAYLHLLASTSGESQAESHQRMPLSLMDQELEAPGAQQHQQLLLGDSIASSRLLKSDQFQPNNIDHHNQLQIQIQQSNAAHAASSIASSGSSTNGANCRNLASLASKSKRVRTTFTEDQLSILQNHFQIDSNPDGQDLERIAVITGLTKRVTQVWFQNSRARQKKYMTRRKAPNQQQQGIAHAQGSSSLDQNASTISQQYAVSQLQQGRIDLAGGECYSKMGDNPVVGSHKWMTGDDTDSSMPSSPEDMIEDETTQFSSDDNANQARIQLEGEESTDR